MKQSQSIAIATLRFAPLAMTNIQLILFKYLNEDDCKIRKDNAPQNFSVLRYIAINFLGKEKTKKLGIKNKQFLAEDG